MKKIGKRNILAMAVLLITQPFLLAQTIDDSIHLNRTREIIQVLAGDSLRGRGNLSPDLSKAARYIGVQYGNMGLQPLTSMPSYFIPFQVYLPQKPITGDQLTINGKEIPSDLFRFLHPAPGAFPTKTLEDFVVFKLDDFIREIVPLQFSGSGKDVLVWTNKFPLDSLAKFPARYNMPSSGMDYNLLMVYSTEAPTSLELTANKEYYNNIQYNLVGVLPGKSLPEEIILYSAHYDHLGVIKSKGDSIMNGANDNASGTTALLMLAEYFAKKSDNERTLIFCAFSGEEIGLIGSHEFSNYIKPEKIIAGINLEMLGIPEYGKKKVFITGQYESSLPQILSKQLRAAGVRTVREPDPEKKLFERSDNKPFARKGVPAHTIMAGSDDDKCYHRPCDDLSRIDYSNLNFLIQAIAKASSGLIEGSVTPTRVNPAIFEQ